MGWIDEMPEEWLPEHFSIETSWSVRELPNLLYPENFEEQIFHVLQTPRCYFIASIRKKKKKHRLKPLVNGDMVRSKPYQVLLKGAYSDMPLPFTEWEKTDNPWINNDNMYVDTFYFGRKYKYEFDYDEGEKGHQGRTSSGLVRHFDTKEEAQLFLEKWTAKILTDHQEVLKEDEIIYQLIQNISQG